MKKFRRCFLLLLAAVTLDLLLPPSPSSLPALPRRGEAVIYGLGYGLTSNTRPFSHPIRAKAQLSDEAEAEAEMA